MPTNTDNPNNNTFDSLGLPEHLLSAIIALGFKTPTPIQIQAIPAMLRGSDVVGLAQTGTGKTLAFGLPALANIEIKRRETQILVLVPTRELALQVAEAFKTFAADMPELNVLPIYGGQGYSTQLSTLRRGAHIVIGTPGRVMDHMRRGSLVLDSLKSLILDEADEMLRMGFAEDVEWILEQCPAKRQTCLFSATMPPAIKNIAERYLNKPEKITVAATSTSAAAIKQYFWQVSNMHKLDALSRILETEESDGVIIFVRTKRATEEVAEQLDSRGFDAVAINGDIVQQQRERVIDQLKSGKLKILVATDVAARGIDVDRITHVINYDVPHNAESYVHRIGRTGRAGRTGTAILFVSPRDKYILRDIERITKQEIQPFTAPSAKTVNERRVVAFKQRITNSLLEDNAIFKNLLQEYLAETSADPLDVAAALATMLQGKKEFLLKKTADITVSAKTSTSKSDRGSKFERSDRSRRDDSDRAPRRNERPRRDDGESFKRVERSVRDDNDKPFTRSERPRRDDSEKTFTRSPRRDDSDKPFTRSERPRRDGDKTFTRSPRRDDGDKTFTRSPTRRDDGDKTFTRSERPRRDERSSGNDRFPRDERRSAPRGRGAETDMDQYRVDIGKDDGLLPKNLVGAIANTAGIEGRYIGKIKIEPKFALIDLPKGMPRDAMQNLKRLKISGKLMNLRKISH